MRGGHLPMYRETLFKNPDLELSTVLDIDREFCLVDWQGIRIGDMVAVQARVDRIRAARLLGLGWRDQGIAQEIVAPGTN